MNPLTLTILTVVANAIVTGIIVYLIQKKIESSFAKQMEEFKASLQYSNFEQQTKFVKSHEKRTEIIVTLHQKFSLFARACETMIHARDIKQQALVMEKLSDFWRYFLANRLFLPDSFEAEIWKIFGNAVTLIGNTSVAFNGSDKQTSLLEFLDELDNQIRSIEILYKSIAEPSAK